MTRPLALSDLLSTAAFLAALLVIAEGCRRQGVFELLARRVALGARGRPGRLLSLAVASAIAVTVALGLDATVVLLTPILLATAAAERLDPKPAAYASVHLANSASLLLPVSNLTNLLAFRASQVSFTRFAALMGAPFLIAVGIDWLVLRVSFRPLADLVDREPVAAAEVDRTARPAYALTVLALTLAGFAGSSIVGVAPVWFAVGAAVLLAAPWLWGGGRPAIGELIRTVEPRLLLAVVVLGLLVRAATTHGLGSAVTAVLPSGAGIGDLLLITAISALLANMINNLPATLILVPVAATLGLGPLLCVLVGVNLGPNLTYGGSVATLLWRRIVHPEPVRVELAEFTRLGALAAVPSLLLVPLAVWASVQVVGA